jgi:threonine-phosphate decarboxylase
MIRGHGGNIQEAAEKLKCSVDEMIDMSSNLNPLGPPPGLFEHLKSHISTILSLPEVDSRGVVTRAAKRYGVGEQNIIVGNGTTQLIYLIPQALSLKRSLIVSPTYSDYADALTMYGKPFDYYFVTEEAGFRLDMEGLDREAENHSAIFICNPNNPTGRLSEKEALDRLIKKHSGTLFVIDESYLPFVSGFEERTFFKPPLMKNVIVIASFSKIFRIPGLRTGFLVGHGDLIEKFHRFLTPWSVNSLAHAALFYLLDPENGVDRFLKESIDFVETERLRFMARFQSARGAVFFEGSTPFILGKAQGGHTAASICEALLHRRILIRNCSNFQGLSDRFFRVSLKDQKTNLLLADALASILSEEPSS